MTTYEMSKGLKAIEGSVKAAKAGKVSISTKDGAFTVTGRAMDSTGLRRLCGFIAAALPDWSVGIDGGCIRVSSEKQEGFDPRQFFGRASGAGCAAQEKQED